MNINIQPLINISRKGSINFHYATGVVTAKNSGFLTTGYNDNIPMFMDYLCRKQRCSSKHAEQVAATNICKQITAKYRDSKKKISAKDFRRKIKKYKLVTIRSRKYNDCDGSKKNSYEPVDGYDILDAPPCKECVKFLLKLGISTVYCTDNNKIIKIKLSEEELDNYNVSDAQKSYKRKNNKIKKNIKI